MKKPLIHLVLLLCFAVPELSGQFNPCNWKYRKRIIFDPARVAGSNDLTDFPALITFTADPDLETVANGGHVDNASGFDIAFSAEDGVTQLSHDLDGYNATTGSLTCWVKIPNLSTSINTYIYMYYGNSAIATDQSSPNTWSNGFVGVWHFDNSLANSTPTTGLDGTNSGSTNTNTAKFNEARHFVRASSQYVDVTPYNAAYDITTDITVSGWVRLTSIGNDQKFAGNQNNSTGGWKFGVFSDNKIEFEIRTTGNSPFLSRSASGGAALAANTWYYVVGIYSDAGNYIRTYRNGTLDRNYGTTASMGASNGTLKFGREPFASSAHLDGILDEMRVSNVVRTADWIATEYENQNAPSTFYAISIEPKLWDGSSSGNWNTNANWTPAGVPTSLQDVIIPNVANQPTLNTSIDIGALWVRSGATLNGGNATRTLSIAFDILNCGTITGNAGNITLNTTTIQTQHLSGTGTFSLNDLTIDNQFNLSPSTQLNASVAVLGDLTLISGLVGTSATNILALGTGATSTSGSQQSFILGPMSKSGSAAFVFPIGKGQEWRRLRISGITAATVFRAEYFDTPYANTTSVNAPLDNVSQIEYWQLDRISGAGDANVSLYWENVSYSGIDDCADLTIARWNGSNWVEHAATEVAGSSCSGAGTGTIMTNAVVTNFSPFSFGSTTPGLNALPVQLSAFTGHCSEGAADLKWTTETETNNGYFSIERSFNGMDFVEAGRVKGAGTSKEQKEYNFRDKDIGAGLHYYRLRQTDLDGRSTFSKFIFVSCSPAADISVYPNPSSGEIVVEGLEKGTMLQLVNSLGQVIYQGVAGGPTHPLHISEKGIYLVQVFARQQQAFKVIVR